jgi:membrane-associated protease RseP (regulator of RpoE activity)
MQDAPRCTELIVPSREPNQLDGLSDKSIKQRAAIYLAGPAFSLLLAVGILGILFTFGGEDVLHDADLPKFEVHIALLASGFSVLTGLFNLLPLMPLDGGRLLFLGIEAFHGKPVSSRVETVLSRTGHAILSLLAAMVVSYGMIELLRPDHSFGWNARTYETRGGER